MARYIKPRIKLYRRENVNLFLKNKFIILKKMNKNLNTIDTDSHSNCYYQLREKQKLKLIYGVMDKQFYNYFLKSKKIGGDIVKNLLIFLEMRLDNVLYKMGFAVTRAEARQIITHRCVFINNIIVNIPSKSVKLGDVIKIKNKCQKQLRIIKSINLHKNNISLCDWIFVNYKDFTGYVSRYPVREDLSFSINDNLILSLYFK